jgi:hypothetical protein
MTVVIAKRFDQAICLVSDTMISDDASGKPNAIPGRLKIVTLSPNFTVAYAGHANQALDAIREVHGVLRSDGPESAIERLRLASSSGPHDIDFIVARHRPAAELCRIWEGKVSESLDQCAIGQTAINAKIEKRFEPTGNPTNDSMNFRLAFIAAFTDRRDRPDAGVGGFRLSLHATPDNHAYKSHSLSDSWKPIELVWGTTTYEDEQDLLTGEWSFRHDSVTTEEPGLAVLAVELPQAKTGYVYAPLSEDDPKPIKLLDHDGPYPQHQDEIHQAMREALEAKVKEHRKRFG